MQLHRSSVLILVFCLILASCQKVLPDIIEVGQTSISFDSPGGQTQLELLSTKSWSATADSPWCLVIPSNGNGGFDIPTLLTVRCYENPGHAERSCTITIRSDNNEQTIAVSQGHRQGVMLDVDQYEISDMAQVFDIHFWASGPVSVEVDPACSSWLTLVGTKAMSDMTRTLSASLNTSAERKGKIYVRFGDETETIFVRQAPSDIPISSLNYKLGLIHSYDLDKDGCLSIEEALQVKHLSIGTQPVTVEDLSYFPNVESVNISDAEIPLDLRPLKKLKYLTIIHGCPGVNLEENDLLQEVIIQYSDLKSLDLRGKGRLENIDIQSGFNLETLLLDNCRSLSRVSLSTIPTLHSLDFHSCSSIKQLGISIANALESVNSQGLPKLESICIDHCYNLTCLDLQDCPSLHEFICEECSIQNLNLEGNTGIKTMRISAWNSVLDLLDISPCTALESLKIGQTKIKSIRMGDKPDLKHISLFSLGLKSIDLSTCPALTSLSIPHNSLTSLDLTLNTFLSFLNCEDNPDLKTVYLSSSSKISSLFYNSPTNIIYR